MKHINIPVFIPHLGCPNQCIFCNQRTISGTLEFDEKKPREEIETALKTVSDDDECEIAFFGGSFTGIDRGLMIRLLDMAQEYINCGKVKAIRMSTRPDYINPEIIDILKNYTISCVELGIQTMNDSVLAYLKRGHTSKDTVNAVKLLKDAGFDFVGQMMIGLPGATPEDEVDCAEKISLMGAIGARIYPTLVLRSTELEYMTVHGEYMPLSIEEAVWRSAAVLKIFSRHNVPCIRIGLCDSENLHSEETFVAGPNSPSIGEMIRSRLFFDVICEKIDSLKSGKNGNYKEITILCPPKATSQVTGNKRENIKKLTARYGFLRIKVREDSSLGGYDVDIIAKED